MHSRMPWLPLFRYCCCNCCRRASTTTLGTSVTLPARRVIFRDAFVARLLPENYLQPWCYHQMAGRAGRQGLDDRGEVFLVHHASGQQPPLAYLQGLLQRSSNGDVSSMLLNGAQQGG